MSSALALWWLALPLLLLPIWWHRQKRQRLKAQPLATARFLPAADPQQLRVWAWLDRALLLLRCLLLLGVLAWLADLAFAWRGDTVLIGPQLDGGWVEAQIQDAGLTQARRLNFCAEADADTACDVRTPRLFAWLSGHEREWRAEARWLVLARGDEVAMPAQLPQLAHRLDLRLQASPLAAAPTEHHIVLASEREPAWRALFKAFESAGLGTQRYVFDPAPDERTELIVWDRPGAPAAGWRAPLWWLAEPAAFAELARAASAPGFGHADQPVDSPRGRLWTQATWPLDDEAGARELFERWQSLQRAPQAYPAPSMAFAGELTDAVLAPLGLLHPLLAPLLALLFALERGLAHARRR